MKIRTVKSTKKVCHRKDMMLVIEHTDCYKYKVEIFKDNEQVSETSISGYACRYSSWWNEIADFVIKELEKEQNKRCEYTHN